MKSWRERFRTIARLARATIACAAAALSGYGCDAPERPADVAPPVPRTVAVVGGDVDTTTAAGRAARSVRAAASVDSTEVSSLGRGMLVPVVGVPTKALRDVFTDSRGRRVHEAIDIMAPRGTPVVSAIDSKLTKLHTSKAGGLMVYAADPSDRFVLLYAHLDRYAPGLVEGAPIRRGQLLGYVGSTGNAQPNAPHLHFAVLRGRPSEAWWKGTPVNPYPLLAGGVTLAELPESERENEAPAAEPAPPKVERAAPAKQAARVATSDDFAPAAAEAEGTAMLVPVRRADSATSKPLATAKARSTSKSKVPAKKAAAKSRAPAKASRTKASSVKASSVKASTVKASTVKAPSGKAPSAKPRRTVSATRAKTAAATGASKQRTPRD